MSAIRSLSGVTVHDADAHIGGLILADSTERLEPRDDIAMFRLETRSTSAMRQIALLRLSDRRARA